MNKVLKVITMSALLMLSTVSFAAVNINTADAHAIQSELKGIGLKKAQAIVAYRKSHGDFKSADELANVKGIGFKIVEQNRDNIVIEQPNAIK